MSKRISRRDFIRRTGTALAGVTFAATAGFPSILLPKKKDKLGVALVGLGQYAGRVLAPALQHTVHCELRGIVTGTPSKIPDWQQRYGIPDANVYNYQTMHEVAGNDDIDIIYIVLPPSMHAEYSILAAEAGKHVWCEKPMAMDVPECRAIIDAAEKNRVQLTIGYRMQHEPNTQTIIRYGREKTYGDLKEVRSGAGFRGNTAPDNWRARPEMGGGALYDMGVYPINAARYATGLEPLAVRGTQRSERENYAKVDEFTDFEMRFPGGITAVCETSFGKSTNYLDITCTGGWYHLRPFQSYGGVQGETSDGTVLPPDPGNQQGRQMDNDALAIKQNTTPIVPGEEGLLDIVVLQAIMESSRRGGEWIEIADFHK
jgi:glucose-fructose oxidoreductase